MGHPEQYRKRRDYCATFTFLQRDTGKMDDEGSGEEGGRSQSLECTGARTRFEQILRRVKISASQSFQEHDNPESSYNQR